MGQAVWALVLQLFRYINLSQYNDSDYNSIINSYIISFDDYCKQFLRPTYSKKKNEKDKIVGYQRPKIPTSNPLLTPGEIKIIKDFVFPIWSELEIYKRSWITLLQKDGYVKTIDNIAVIYRNRWEIVKNISQMTTKRLQVIRKMLKDDKLTKVKVTSDSFIQMLRARTNSGKMFLDELSQISGKHCYAMLSTSYAERYKSKDINTLISIQIIDAYVNDKIIESPEKRDTVSSDFNNKYQSSRKLLIDISNRMTHLRNLIYRCNNETSKRDVKISISREVVNVCCNIREDYEKLQKIEGEIIVFTLKDLNITDQDFNKTLSAVHKVFDYSLEKGLQTLKKKVNLSAEEQASFLSAFHIISIL